MHLAEMNFPDCRIIDPTVMHDDVKDEDEELGPGTYPDEANWSLAREIVTPEKLIWAIDCLDPYKFPGPDGIFPALLCKAEDLLMIPLLRIFTASLANGYLPKI